MTLEEFIKKVLREEVENDSLHPNLSRVIGLEPNLPARVTGKDAEDCMDNKDRTFRVVLQNDAPNGGQKPMALVLYTKKLLPGALQDEILLLKPDGTIEKATSGRGRRDQDGKSIRGSAIRIDLDPDEAKRVLQRELDFWLRGIGLKKKAAAGKAQAETPAKPAGEGKPQAAPVVPTKPKP